MNRLISITCATALAVFSAPAFAQNGAELRMVKQTLSQLQKLSFRHDREYCGYFVFDKNDDMLATKATKGEQASCAADDYAQDLVAFASYHTHGAASDEGSFELPSYLDVEGDMDEGVDGYVATPGGRLWYIDTQEETINLICGLKCLPQDSKFIEYEDEVPENSYTFEQLRLLELEDS